MPQAGTAGWYPQAGTAGWYPQAGTAGWYRRLLPTGSYLRLVPQAGTAGWYLQHEGCCCTLGTGTWLLVWIKLEPHCKGAGGVANAGTKFSAGHRGPPRFSELRPPRLGHGFLELSASPQHWAGSDPAFSLRCVTCDLWCPSASQP